MEVTFMNTGKLIEKTYSIPKTHWIREYGLDTTDAAKLKVMEEYGKVEIVNIEKVKEDLFQDEVKVSFNDIPDKGHYEVEQVVLPEKYPVDTETIRPLIGTFEWYSKIEDVKILATKMDGKTDGKLSGTPQQLKAYLVSYYVPPKTTSQTIYDITEAFVVAINDTFYWRTNW
jgi:hypothetical protein